MSGKNQGLLVAGIWAVLTAGGVALSLSVGLLPSMASEEARIVDEATTVLTVLSVPVFMMVVVVLAYSMVKFRRRGEPTEDGPPIQGNLQLEVAWVVVTVVLVLFLAGYGSKGLLDMRAMAAEAHDALVVQVNGSQWFWEFYYPEQGIRTREELRLPVGRPVRFEITSSDVLHSFWVPAFRMKIDAVPGMVTTINATPTKLGAFQDDYNFRLQCAELCGLSHGIMTSPVVVVEQNEFDAWVATQKSNTK
jgi:cytochrome c oxidase subunit 2